jgi:hypothetical protein
MKKFSVEFFQNAGRRGGKSRSDKKRTACRRNMAKARAARWGKSK